MIIDVTPQVEDSLRRMTRDERGSVSLIGGVQTYDSFEAMAAEPRVSVTALQTVGSKGYDGFALALVLR